MTLAVTVETRLTRRFGLTHPILSAPMAFVAGGRLRRPHLVNRARRDDLRSFEGAVVQHGREIVTHVTACGQHAASGIDLLHNSAHAVGGAGGDAAQGVLDGRYIAGGIVGKAGCVTEGVGDS